MTLDSDRDLCSVGKEPMGGEGAACRTIEAAPTTEISARPIVKGTGDPDTYTLCSLEASRGSQGPTGR